MSFPYLSVLVIAPLVGAAVVALDKLDKEEAEAVRAELAQKGVAPDAVARLVPDHSPAWRGLGVSILHVVLLDHLFPSALAARPQCRYVHLLREVTQTLASRQCDLAVLVPPASMDHVEQIAGNLEKMPPKSTYFYPKLLSGLVFNSLRAQ